MSDDILDSLPEVKFFKRCQKCGSTNWTGCNLSADNRVVIECSDCPGLPKEWSPIQQDIPDGHIHTMPNYGKKHFENKDCWCEPILDYKDSETGKELWVHNEIQ